MSGTSTPELTAMADAALKASQEMPLYAVVPSSLRGQFNIRNERTGSVLRDEGLNPRTFGSREAARRWLARNSLSKAKR